MMRGSVWIQGGFVIFFCAAAWMTQWTRHPLSASRRKNVTMLAVLALAALALTQLSSRMLSPAAFLAVLDLVTMALFLVPYWQTGQFFTGPNKEMQNRLMEIDHWLLPGVCAKSGTEPNALGLVLEIAYLSCYPLVPAAVLTVYLAGLRDRIGGFWLVLLLATYVCYAITPLVPALPPRALLEDGAGASTQPSTGRALNRWILRHGSIHAISFPSAHVASAFAIALVLLYYAPAIGFVFLVVAILISLGAVLGRYHYAADVIAGALTALIVFMACLPYL
ncbi:MAG TPA: phosphatase PAP2 family protein [Edaphobacter sp.]|nr:phosphatase PAP2 family protein [Edaphobacter sp.]